MEQWRKDIREEAKVADPEALVPAEHYFKKSKKNT